MAVLDERAEAFEMPGDGILGRHPELEALDRFRQTLMTGASAAIVVHGEPGVGKTTVVARFCVTQTSCQVLSIAGTESEMELPWAGLHQLCTPLLPRLCEIPSPQRAALEAAFGLSGEGTPEPFRCGLAVLSLLTDAAEGGPLICVIDNVDALDQPSLRTLGFVSRRLQTESVGLIFVSRDVPSDLARVPTLRIDGLPDEDAGALLDTVTHSQLEPAARRQLIAETYGNPLAILELAGHGHVRRSAGGYHVPGGAPITGQIEASFLATAQALDPGTQKVLLLAAAEPTGDVALLRRAAAGVGLELPAESERLKRLVSLCPVVRFRHPLVRSAIYADAADGDRRAAHRALADAFESGDDPIRRIWHRAQSLQQPDEPVARELEQAAAAVQERGGSAAAAAFLARAADLTPAASDRARRELDASRARLESGDPAGALSLLSVAETRGLDAERSAHAQLLRGQLSFHTTRGDQAPKLLLAAARALAPFDRTLSRDTYLAARNAAIFAGTLASGENVGSVARAILSEAPVIDPKSPADLLLSAAAQLDAFGPARAAPAVRAAIRSILAEENPSEQLRLVWTAGGLAMDTFDDQAMVTLAELALEIARRNGLLEMTALAAINLGGVKQRSGDLPGANALFQEAISICEAIGAPSPHSAALGIHASTGDLEQFNEMVEPVLRAAAESAEGYVLTLVQGLTARVHLAHRNYRTALDCCQKALASGLNTMVWVYAFDYAESAARAGTREETAQARDYLQSVTAAADTAWARALRALSCALLDASADPEPQYRASITDYRTTGHVPTYARVHLLFGEWLRREGRRAESRHHLRRAHELLSSTGCTAFAARASSELARLGETTRRQPALDDQLTPQELQVAHMAAVGLSNREIAQRLYLSHRTVGAHLYRIFPKLGISSRSQLHLVLEQPQQ
jgi:DNA-binding CsgD family transcriptional regulator